MTGNGQEYRKGEIDTLLNYGIKSLRLDGKYEEALTLNIELIKTSEELNYQKGVHLGYLCLGSLLCESGVPQREIHQYLLKYTQLNDDVNKREKEMENSLVKAPIVEQKTKYRRISSPLHYISLGMVILCLTILFFVLMYFKKKENERAQLIFEKNRIIGEKEIEINELRKKLNVTFEEVVSLAKENAPSFLVRFQEVYPEVCTKLLAINPKLVNTELTFCAMLWLNFSSKEIARYTFVQPKTVQIKKYRLRKKLGIPLNEDIYLWIRNL